jgi:nitrogen regulatory protein PII
METLPELKALYIVVNAGHVDEIMEIIREAGAPGGTVIHARGESSEHQLIMGITVDFEREVIISIVDKDTADRVMMSIKEKAGWETEAHGICYTMPVERAIGVPLSK